MPKRKDRFILSSSPLPEDVYQTLEYYSSRRKLASYITELVRHDLLVQNTLSPKDKEWHDQDVEQFYKHLGTQVQSEGLRQHVVHTNESLEELTQMIKRSLQGIKSPDEEEVSYASDYVEDVDEDALGRITEDTEIDL